MLFVSEHDYNKTQIWKKTQKTNAKKVHDQNKVHLLFHNSIIRSNN